MGAPTKDELLAQLKDLGVDADPKLTNAELQELINRTEAENAASGFGAEPGDSVTYLLRVSDAEDLTRREARFARFVKAVAPFEPRVYSEGDAMYGRVYSSYDDGTVDIDLLGSFPRLTLKGVEIGGEIGQCRVRS